MHRPLECTVSRQRRRLRPRPHWLMYLLAFAVAAPSTAALLLLSPRQQQQQHQRRTPATARRGFLRMETDGPRPLEDEVLLENVRGRTRAVKWDREAGRFQATTLRADALSGTATTASSTTTANSFGGGGSGVQRRRHRVCSARGAAVGAHRRRVPAVALGAAECLGGDAIAASAAAATS